MKKLPQIVAYILVLFWEIVKANVNLFFRFYANKKTCDPVMVTFETGLKSRIARSLLANSITLTPGTITMSMEGSTFTVHCIDKSLAEGLDKSVFEKRLLKLEEGFDK